jgi:homoserine kinase type II
VAAFTSVSADEIDAFLSKNGIAKCNEFLVVEGGSVNSNFSMRAGGIRFFLRLYEEQDEVGARREMAMLGELARKGVATPEPIASGAIAGKPAAMFPWVDGVHACQRGVNDARAYAVGEALAHVHVSRIDAGEGRFDERALRARLARIDDRFPVARLTATLDALITERARDLPSGLVHGDLFRDNVLFDAAAPNRIAALLDFESASHGPFVYDLAVTVLAWCFGDSFDASLVSAMTRGYESVRPLAVREKRAFYTELKMAALRFTITRITDYEMRGVEGASRVMKDWRRFLARLDALEQNGPLEI